MASTEPPKPVKHKTCVLRVSIHCEGCKRKVNKILQSVPGVHDVEIERQLHRVVVTGDMSPESLVRKLVKSGKHAELWPENPPQNQSRRTENLTGNEETAVSEKKIKPPATKTEAPPVESAGSGKEIKPPVSKTETPAVDPPKSSDSVVQSGVAPVGNGKAVEDVGGKVKSEMKIEEKKRETGSASDSASPPVVEKKEKQAGNGSGEVSGAGGGGEGKKKKKKKKEGQNSNITNVGETSSSSEASPKQPPQQTTTRSTNQSPPRQHGYNNPTPYHHVPVYTVSYNTAHPPVNSYTASYHAAAPPQSYAYYSHYGSPPSPPPLSVPSDYESYTQQPVDSFEMFSDENPNGCLIM